MSHTEARELAVPDVRLWEAGIREQDVIQTTSQSKAISNMLRKKHMNINQDQKQGWKENRVKQMTVWKRFDDCDLMVLLNDFVPVYPWNIFVCWAVLHHTISVVFLWIWWSFCVTGQWHQSLPYWQHPLLHKTRGLYAKFWPTRPVCDLMYCYEALYFQWGFSNILFWPALSSVWDEK